VAIAAESFESSKATAIQINAGKSICSQTPANVKTTDFRNLFLGLTSFHCVRRSYLLLGFGTRITFWPEAKTLKVSEKVATSDPRTVRAPLMG
jgi:hypothetical protein